MKRINVYITDPQAEALQRIADQTDRPMAEVLRRALDIYLAHPEAQDHLLMWHVSSTDE